MKKILIVMLLISVFSEDLLSEIIVFRGKEGVYVRWRGIRNASIDGYKVERRTPNGEWQLLNLTPLTITTSLSEMYGKSTEYNAAIYLSLFGIKDRMRELTQADIARVYSDEEASAFVDIVSITNPSVARLLGEIFTDFGAYEFEAVEYRIIAIYNGREEPYAESGLIDLSQKDIIPQINEIRAESTNQAALIEWKRNLNAMEKGEIVSYNIYRAENPLGPFEQMNANPLLPVNVSSGDDYSDPELQSYYDQFLHNGTEYYYYVVALNSFGLESEHSELVKVVPGENLTPVSPSNINFQILGNRVQITWEVNSDEFLGVNIYKSEENNNAFKRVFPKSDVLYNNSINSWLDFELIEGESAYYYLEAVGKNNNVSSPSDTLFFFFEDKTPPSTPQNITAIADTGKIIIYWNANTEKDLLGYEIERASDARFSTRYLLNSEVIKDTFFIDTFEAETQTTFGYVVYALDKSMNRSSASEIIKVRPKDIVAPNPPLTLELKQIDESILFRWTNSFEEDFLLYKVYRAFNDSTRLTAIEDVYINSFTDAPSEFGRYFYAVSSLDSSMNESQILQITGITFNEVAPQPPANGEITYESGRIVLNWQASTSVNTSGYFIKRRNVATNDLIDMKELGSNQLTFSDKYVSSGDEYIYYIYARDKKWRLSRALELRIVVE